MALWDTDLTTEDGALGATQMGSLACGIAALISGFYLLVVFGITAGETLPGEELMGSAILWFLLIELPIFATAAFLFRSGKGVIPGIAAAVLLGLEVLVRLAGLAIIPLIFDSILLILTINGVRGARALRKGIINTDETAEVFR